jgi:hypothetical protein
VNRRSRWLAALLLLLLLTAVLAVVLEPTGTVRAFLAGEPFYALKPLRHWREVLREQGRQGSVSRDVRVKFWNSDRALPVLFACAGDPDRNVRWPAVYLVGHHGRGKAEALTVLVKSLRDEDQEVRLQALHALASWGPLASAATPDVADALRDDKLQVAFTADFALWEIDAQTALAAGGWKTYRSADWGFSAMMPGSPEVSQLQNPVVPVTMHLFQVGHKVGAEESPTRYIVAVGDYPEEVVRASTEQERNRAIAEQAAAGLKGKVVQQRDVNQGGRKGREHTIEVADKGVVRARVFWSGRRLYIVSVVSQPKFLNPKPADYFLDSFRLSGAR